MVTPCSSADPWASASPPSSARWCTESVSDDLSQRQLRARLRLAIERAPAVLLLDHLRRAGSALKGYLRSLAGTGLGVLLVADTETADDRAAARGLRLSYRECQVPPLPPRHLRALVRRLIDQGALGVALANEDIETLVRYADGRPGYLDVALRLLGRGASWREGRVQHQILKAATHIEMMRRYLGARED